MCGIAGLILSPVRLAARSRGDFPPDRALQHRDPTAPVTPSWAGSRCCKPAGDARFVTGDSTVFCRNRRPLVANGEVYQLPRNLRDAMPASVFATKTRL